MVLLSTPFRQKYCQPLPGSPAESKTAGFSFCDIYAFLRAKAGLGLASGPIAKKS
jgi:hypothetical protein